MTTRLKGFTVALEEDIREDDAEGIQNAITSLRHVLSVNPIESTANDWINRQRIRNELRTKIFDVLEQD